MTNWLTAIYLLCFAGCAVPAIIRLRQRKRSDDLSYLREITLLVGVTCQWIVMMQTRADWRVWLSPVMSFTSVLILLGHIYAYRRGSLLQ